MAIQLNHSVEITELPKDTKYLAWSLIDYNADTKFADLHGLIGALLM